MPTGEVVDGHDGRPLAGVAVSDGLVVARTEADGTFSIPRRADAEFVFVTVPSTHRALEGRWFADVRAGASDPLRFELQPGSTGSAGCRFVQVTDLHVSVDGGARLRPMIEAGVEAPAGIAVTGETSGAELRADLELVVEREHPDFIAATGDLADYGQREELAAYREAITGLGVPVASIPGNHDHLSCLTREAIDEFFGAWAMRDDTEGLSAGEEFQREVFGGDWRRAASGRAPWVEEIGPLYYSFDWGGVHFVAYDGEGLRRYGADYPQDAWLAADLSLVPEGTPVVVCTHFPEDREFYRSRFGRVRLVGSISGHWHGTRAWHDGEARHWTSSTLGFGGIDYTPRGYRVVEVDARGARSRWETIEEPSGGTARVAGSAVRVGGRIVVVTEDADVRGSVRAVDGWTRALETAARGGLSAADGLLYLLDLNAQLVALDATTGAPRWAQGLGDPSVRWTLGRPAVAAARVYAGSAMSVDAFVAADGTRLWHTDLASADWAASWSGVCANDDAVVVGAMSDDLHLAVLDPDTGTVRWRHSGRDIAGVCATPVLTDGVVLALRAPGWLAAYDFADGQLQWQQPLDDAWPVALALAGEVALVRSATGRVSAHGVGDGRVRWECDLGPGRRAGRAYSRLPGAPRLPLVVVGDRVWTATFDELVGLDLGSGGVAVTAPVGGEVATVLADGDGALAVTVAGDIVHAP
ncbi:MAG TPA: PQQ-binding-like beta-propeller repeat protein [Acidimicrobiia bacterium]|jgi:outer membrane protein assembly factor BamB